MRSAIVSSPRLVAAIALAASLALVATWSPPAAVSDDGDGPVRGFGAPGEDPALDSDLDSAEIKKAIGKGLEWLRKQQNADGSFQSSHSGTYPMGPTAIAVLTLLKCGADKNDPAVVKGFDFMRQKWQGGGGGGSGAGGLGGMGGMLSGRRTYDVALVVLAIEARYAPTEKMLEKSKDDYATVARKVFRKANKQDRAWIEEAVKWFVQTQEARVWRYPGGGQDLSCTQYVLLALKAASRMGVKVPSETFKKALDYLLVEQDKSGSEVDYFPLPAADGPIAKMKAKKKPRRIGKSKPKSGGTVEREGGGSESGERPKMFARGWAYMPRHGGQSDGSTTKPQGGGGAQPGGGAGGFPMPGGGGAPGGGGMPLPGGLGGGAFSMTTGSMTAAGVAGVVICKSELEADKSFWKRFGSQADQSIRDGCAWLAKNFSVRTNPPGGNHHYYYLYGLERAGVLAGTYDFGEHDWYDEGGKYILGAQKSDGSWVESLGGLGIGGIGGADAMSDTCFALLFLKRATVPVVDIPPKRVITESFQGSGK